MNAKQLANLLELSANEGSIPSRDTLLKAAQTIRELSELCDELTDIIGGEDEIEEVD